MQSRVQACDRAQSMASTKARDEALLLGSALLLSRGDVYFIYGTMLSERTDMDAVYAAMQAEPAVWTCKNCAAERPWQSQDVKRLWNAWSIKKWRAIEAISRCRGKRGVRGRIANRGLGGEGGGAGGAMFPEDGCRSVSFAEGEPSTVLHTHVQNHEPWMQRRTGGAPAGGARATPPPAHAARPRAQNTLA